MVMVMRRSLAYVVLAILCSAGIHSPVRLQGQASGASLTPWLDTALRQGTADQRHAVWVYYRDKGARVTAQSTSLPVSARALGRRARRYWRLVVAACVLLMILSPSPRS